MKAKGGPSRFEPSDKIDPNRCFYQQTIHTNADENVTQRVDKNQKKIYLSGCSEDSEEGDGDH